MNEKHFIIAIGILTLISTLITSNGNLHDSQKRLFKRLTKMGWLTFGIGLLIIALSVFQLDFVKRKEEAESNARDSIITSKVNDYQRKIFEDLSSAFANQRMKLDTVNNQIFNLRDSAKTIIINPEPNYPIITIFDNGITHKISTDSIFINIHIRSSAAPAKLKLLNTIGRLNYQDGTSDVYNLLHLVKNPVYIPAETELTLDLYFQKLKNVNIESIDFFFWGEYSGIQNKSILVYNNLVNYNFMSKKNLVANEVIRDSLLRKYQIRWH